MLHSIFKFGLCNWENIAKLFLSWIFWFWFLCRWRLKSSIICLKLWARTCIPTHSSNWSTRSTSHWHSSSEHTSVWSSKSTLWSHSHSSTHHRVAHHHWVSHHRVTHHWISHSRIHSSTHHRIHHHWICSHKHSWTHLLHELPLRHLTHLSLHFVSFFFLLLIYCHFSHDLVELLNIFIWTKSTKSLVGCRCRMWRNRGSWALISKVKLKQIRNWLDFSFHFWCWRSLRLLDSSRDMRRLRIWFKLLKQRSLLWCFYWFLNLFRLWRLWVNWLASVRSWLWMFLCEGRFLLGLFSFKNTSSYKLCWSGTTFQSIVSKHCCL